ncbi:MAG TPA: ParB/RepB/Spo0J family partition protein [Acidimicrobiia bacterium]
MATRRSGLGKGLEALIPTEPPASTAGFSHIPVDKIAANPDQPRSGFDDESLEQLAASISEYGLLQPVIVEESENGYTLVAGERRLRAAKRIGLGTIPAVVRATTGNQTLVEAIVENVQRSDLSPLEEARAYSRLLEEYGMSQEEIATRVGKSRPTISNTLRLLQLPVEIQDLCEDGSLSNGHVRALLGLEDEKYAIYLAGKAVAEGWSVRQTEDAVRARRETEGGSGGVSPVRSVRPVEIIELEKRLGDQLSAAVKINYRNQKGKVEIKFNSVAELERLYRTITD